MKKLLMLGGAQTQVPAIKAAKEMGLYVIITDYLEDNPGQQFADESYNISTTDKKGVLALAKSLEIDGIVSYASEHAAPIAAYVAENLGLPSSPYKSVEILTMKDLFKTFLRENNFNVPKAKGYHSLEEAKADFYNFKMPVMIKPVDSCGSRGVSKIDSIELLQEKVEDALRFSKNKRFIIEEYIEKCGYQVGGDGFSVNGKLVFRCFSNEHFSPTSSNPFVPVGSSFPSNLPEYIQDKIHNEIQRVLDLLNMQTGAYNFDILVDSEEDVYLLEIAARNGGDWIPQVTKYATDIDMVEYTIKGALGEDCSDLICIKPKGFWSSYAVNSLNSGIFKGVEIHKELKENNLIEHEITAKNGDSVFAFTGSHLKIGTLLVKYSSMEEMLEKMDNMTNWIQVIVEDSLIKNI
ncbi:carbamoyl-phosphate-synthetase [Solibacillus sp. R5-41]|uniref:ATP-grasp domain-containing protein n=1 Tax=Solibacillus sp. R5-41 TaxID=2048654 RepID=UPI000C12945D|nr:ATP-grasp domain-containing protein [Solibacillus sp. R5-41]ATP39440.1 carbamoyl-phosphate-synthetase [Solibacillus sp. R5-41]